MTTPPRPALAAAAAAVLATALTSCSALKTPLSAPPSYHVTAYFAKAVSFYPGSRVQVMGINVGRVDSVTPINGQVRVVASIDQKVPLPATATAAIVPLSLIGERTLTFTPAWQPGQPKLTDGTVLPQNRTQIPVEVNDALKSFGKLLDSFDPAKADLALGNTATTINGNGTAFNQAFQQTGQLVTNLAGQDQQLLRTAQNLNRLAAVVRGREKTLASLVDNFGAASKMLADERTDIKILIDAIADLAERGNVLIKTHQDTLPGDLLRTAQITLMIKGSAASVGQFLQSLKGFGFGFVNSFDTKTKTITTRVTLDNFLRAYLTAILREPEPNKNVPCPLPPPYSNCQ
ncbi:MCE family protein [Actinomadura scrupuli]|uniref:MCE family protein n=1 Tax=Actinomadura scrupuli TaxID=559629 RepID=UPI003D97B21A